MTKSVQFDALGVPYQDWDTKTLAERFPFYDQGIHGNPVRRPDDDAFWFLGLLVTAAVAPMRRHQVPFGS